MDTQLEHANRNATPPTERSSGNTLPHTSDESVNTPHHPHPKGLNGTQPVVGLPRCREKSIDEIDRISLRGQGGQDEVEHGVCRQVLDTRHDQGSHKYKIV